MLISFSLDKTLKAMESILYRRTTINPFVILFCWNAQHLFELILTIMKNLVKHLSLLKTGVWDINWQEFLKAGSNLKHLKTLSLYYRIRNSFRWIGIKRDKFTSSMNRWLYILDSLYKYKLFLLCYMQYHYRTPFPSVDKRGIGSNSLIFVILYIVLKQLTFKW